MQRFEISTAVAQRHLPAGAASLDRHKQVAGADLPDGYEVIERRQLPLSYLRTCNDIEGRNVGERDGE